MVKQVDVSESKLHALGGLWTIIQTTMGMFAIFVMMITMFGFYSLVYYQYFPNFWLFVGLLGVVWAILAIFAYLVLWPAQVGFQNRQWWQHDSPLRKELEEVHAVVNSIAERLDLNSSEDIEE